MDDTGWQKFQWLMTQRRYAQAEQEARAIVAADPGSDLGYFFLARALTEQRKYADAKGAIEEAIRLEPDDAKNLYTLATIHLSVGEHKDALQVSDRAIEMDASDADLHHVRAVALLNLRRNKEALAAADAGLTLDPQSSGLQTTRADALHALGEAGDAKAELLRRLAEDPNDDVVHCRLGEVLLLEGNPDAAAQHFREALRIDPEFAAAREGLIESLKSRSFLYSLVLRFGYWCSTLPRGMVGIGLFVGILAPFVIGRFITDPITDWVFDSIILLIVFVSQLVLVSDAVTTLLLRLDRKNRIILTDRQRRVSNWQIAPLAAFFLSFLLAPFLLRMAILASACVFAQATESIEHVFEPPSRSSRRRLWALYALGAFIGLITVAWFAGPGIGFFAAALTVWGGFEMDQALKYAVWTGLALFLISLYGCFGVIEQWSKRLVIRDRLAGHFHEDE